jgi:plastocyanin
VRRVLGLGVAVLLAGVGLVGAEACGSDDEGPEVQGPPSGSSPVASASPGSASSTGDSLLVELDDFYIEPKEITGKVGETLAVTAFSEGTQTHTLTIEALGVDREFPPSDTQEFSLPLKKAGEFKVYCRFHRDKGMTAVLKVSK